MLRDWEPAVLTIYREKDASIRSSSSPNLPPYVIWIDLLEPTNEEKAFVESRTSIQIPSIESLSEIESSSRLTVDRETVYLSVPVVAQGDTVDAHLSPAGLILTRSLLITVRFASLCSTPECDAKLFASVMKNFPDPPDDKLTGDLDKACRQTTSPSRQ